jgi:hypothetical protein
LAGIRDNTGLPCNPSVERALHVRWVHEKTLQKTILLQEGALPKQHDTFALAKAEKKLVTVSLLSFLKKIFFCFDGSASEGRRTIIRPSSAMLLASMQNVFPTGPVELLQQ